MTAPDLDSLLPRLNELRSALAQAVVGQHEVVEQLLIGLLAGGHCLLEGVPGLGKTLLVRSLGQALELQFRRVQFTPDLMPSDILGTELLEEDHGTGKRAFRFQQGPIFTNLLLADEINRTPPKTQAALLEAMQERTVSYAGTTYTLPSPFFVLATQNPIEQAGTYPLPEAQLDRFLFKLIIDYPSDSEEREIVRRHGHCSAMPKISDFGISPLVGSMHLAEARALTAQIRLTDALVDYIVDIVRATRRHPAIEVGVSTRAANMMAAASRAYAAICGRDFVLPDDIKRLAIPLMRHRVVMTAASDIEGVTSDEALRTVVDQTVVPR